MSDKQRAVLMEDRRNVFYEWQNETTYAEIHWKDMQKMVTYFVESYRSVRVAHADLSDEEIRERLKQDAEIAERCERFPMMFRLCTSRTSDRKVFEGFRKVIAGRKAIQEGLLPEEEVYPRVFHELAELFKLDRRLTEEEESRAAQIPSVEHALALGPNAIETLAK